MPTRSRPRGSGARITTACQKVTGVIGESSDVGAPERLNCAVAWAAPSAHADHSRSHDRSAICAATGPVVLVLGRRLPAMPDPHGLHISRRRHEPGVGFLLWGSPEAGHETVTRNHHVTTSTTYHGALHAGTICDFRTRIARADRRQGRGPSRSRRFGPMIDRRPGAPARPRASRSRPDSRSASGDPLRRPMGVTFELISTSPRGTPSSRNGSMGRRDPRRTSVPWCARGGETLELMTGCSLAVVDAAEPLACVNGGGPGKTIASRITRMPRRPVRIGTCTSRDGYRQPKIQLLLRGN